MRIRQLVRPLIRAIPNAERKYINDRGTLITIAVRSIHDDLRNARVTRADESVSSSMQGIAEIEASRRYYDAKTLLGRKRLHALDVWTGMHRADLDRAHSEVNAAKRVVSERNNRGDICVVHVSPVKMPRVWPNALPGGTSPRRAANNVAIKGASDFRAHIKKSKQFAGAMMSVGAAGAMTGKTNFLR